MDMSEIDRLEAKALIPVSEAMRRGARIRAQGHGFLMRHGKSCAIGAALEGMGYDGPWDVELEDLAEPYRGAILAADRAFLLHFGKCIVRANDRYFWGRDAIADVLERLGH